MLKDITGAISNRQQLPNYALTLTLDAIECSCRGCETTAAYRLYGDCNELDAIVWNSCSRTALCALHRHVMGVPLPEANSIKEYSLFIDNYILPPLEQKLQEFDYSYTEWYNRLTASKQRELIDAQPDGKPARYTLFCKRQVDLVDNPQSSYYASGLPKNRAIMAPGPSDKITVAPVMWALESVFADNFAGYCGGKNWDELEKQLQNNYKKGYRYICQGDGSGFDRTQSHELKYLDRQIYAKVKHSVHHCDPDDFYEKATARYRTVTVPIYKNGIITKLDSITIDGTVTSGSPDTTLMNTARMATYCRFMIYKANIDAKVWAKGDDFVIFYKNKYDEPKLKAVFDQYWSPKGANINKEYGLGLTLKFLIFGDYSTFDFCSTHLICDFKNEIFKIVRQWDRIVKCGQYSIKALSYSKKQKNQYIEDLCVAMEKWTNGMPYYTEYVQHLRSLYTGPKARLTINGKQKTILPHDNHRMNHSQVINDDGYGRDYNYGLLLRNSTTQIDNKIVNDFFLQKYGLVYSEKPWEI